MDKRHPHQARLDARDYPYSNVLAERAAHREIDQAVFDRVHQLEKLTVAAAEASKENARARVNASLDAIQRLREEVLEPLRSGAALTPELAHRYEVLAEQAGQARAGLSRAIAESEYHEKRCADPYADYCQIMEKFPLLRPSL